MKLASSLRRNLIVSRILRRNREMASDREPADSLPDDRPRGSSRDSDKIAATREDVVVSPREDFAKFPGSDCHLSASNSAFKGKCRSQFLS